MAPCFLQDNLLETSCPVAQAGLPESAMVRLIFFKIKFDKEVKKGVY